MDMTSFTYARATRLCPIVTRWRHVDKRINQDEVSRPLSGSDSALILTLPMSQATCIISFEVYMLT